MATGRAPPSAGICRRRCRRPALRSPRRPLSERAGRETGGEPPTTKEAANKDAAMHAGASGRLAVTHRQPPPLPRTAGGGRQGSRRSAGVEQ